MATSRALSGILLAGGGSLRMGQDKALVVYRGETLATAALRTLDRVCDDVVIASGDGRRLVALGRRQVADPVAGRGPLGGIVAGLGVADHPLVAVLAVDLPDASATLFRALAAAWEPGDAVVVPRADGRLQPLHAVWARAARDDLQARLHAGQPSVLVACSALGARVVDVADAAFARNVNTPRDLRA